MVTETIIPKGYRKAAVGVIPDDWDVKKLGEVAEIKTGKKNNDDKVEEGLYPFFVRSQQIERINSYSFDGEAILIPGEGNIGSIYHYINGRFDYHQRVYKISNFAEQYSGKFIYLSMSQNFNTHAMKNSVKATVDSLRLPTFQEFEIAFPPTKAEQTAIATALSDADTLISKLEELISKKINIKQGTMQGLLTGKKRLPGFNGKWEVKALGKIGIFRGGSGFPIRYQGGIEGQYPFFKVSDMNNEGNQTFMITSNNWIDDNLKKQIGANTFPKHTIVFAKIGAAIFLERKKILSQESCIDNNMMGFMFDENILNYRFIHYLFKTIQLGKFVSATALPSLNGRELAELQFSIPDNEEQAAISTILFDMDLEIEQLEQKLDKYKMIKQGMMQELLTGKTRLI